MSEEYLDIQNITAITELQINQVQWHVSNITDDKDESHQGKIARLSKDARMQFSDIQMQGNKVFNKAFIFGLGAQGPTKYAADKQASNTHYDRAKAEAVADLRRALDNLQKQNELQITSKSIFNFIKEFHIIQFNLDNTIKNHRAQQPNLTSGQKILAFLNIANLRRGGKIGEIIHSNKYNTLLVKLAKLYVFLKEHERYKELSAQRQIIYSEAPRLFRHRPDRQKIDFDNLIAAEKREEKRYARSSKRLMACIEEQAYFERTGISLKAKRLEKKYEDKFQAMIKNTFAAREIKLAKPEEKPIIIDGRDHKHSK